MIELSPSRYSIQLLLLFIGFVSFGAAFTLPSSTSCSLAEIHGRVKTPFLANDQYNNKKCNYRSYNLNPTFATVSKPIGKSVKISSTNNENMNIKNNVDNPEKNSVDNVNIRLTVAEQAKTVCYVANSATLSTFSSKDCTDPTQNTEDLCAEINYSKGLPFGSYVDYILDDKGWPVLLLSEQSLHTQNLLQENKASMMIQMPSASAGNKSKFGTIPGNTAAAAMARVTLLGEVVPVNSEDLPLLKSAFSIVHSYSERLVDSPKFSFYKLKPNAVYYVGGFGVMSKWIPTTEYELAEPDMLAQEVSNLMRRLNSEHYDELLTSCSSYLGIEKEDVEMVQVKGVDRLGMDLRVTRSSTGATDEYRIGFRDRVTSSEDAKSEIIKTFQEAWERENGYFWSEELPPIIRYAEDILRKK